MSSCSLNLEQFIKLNFAYLQGKFEINNFASDEAIAYSQLILQILMSTLELEVELLVSGNLDKTFETLLPVMNQFFKYACNPKLIAGYKLNIGNYALNLAELQWSDPNCNQFDSGLIAWIVIDERILLLDDCKIFDILKNRQYYYKVDYDPHFESANYYNDYKDDALTIHTPSSDPTIFTFDEQQQVSSEFKIIKKSRGTDKLCLKEEDYRFNIHKKEIGKEQWRCDVKGCNARLHTNDCKIFKKVGKHNHQQHQRSKTRSVNIAKTIKKNRNHYKTPNNKISKLPNCLFHDRNMPNFTDCVYNVERANVSTNITVVFIEILFFSFT